MNIKLILEENIKKEKNHKNGSGCLMVDFSNRIKNWNDVLKIIEPADLYNPAEDPTYGFEKNPHVTVLYGFNPEVTAQDVKDLLEGISQFIKVKLTGVSIFAGGDKKPYDVVKFTVESDDLQQLHDKCKELPNNETFPDYTPHLTVAYVKAGRGERYVKELTNAISMEGNTFVYSDPDRDKTDWKIRKKYKYDIKINESVELEDTNFPEISDFNNGIWYHGRNVDSDIFSLDYVGLDGVADQEGAGFYFSNLFEESEGYAGHGGYVMKCQLNYNKPRILTQKSKPNIKVVQTLIKNSPNMEDTLSNFGENIKEAYNEAVRIYMESDNVRDCYQTIEADFYRGKSKDFLINISKFYDGYIVQQNPTRYHLIVYNPNIIQIIDKKQV